MLGTQPSISSLVFFIPSFDLKLHSVQLSSQTSAECELGGGGTKLQPIIIITWRFHVCVGFVYIFLV